MDSETPRESARQEPQLRAWTLEFDDAELERKYRNYIRLQTARAVRFGLVLAILLFALFGALDVLLRADNLLVLFVVRAVVIVAAALIIPFSYSSVFERWHQATLVSFCAFMAVGLSAIIIAGGLPVAEHYFMGYVLIAIAAYLILGVSFVGGTVASVLVFTSYLLTEYLLLGRFDLDTLIDSTFLLSAILIAGLGLHSLDRQRRLAYSHGLYLERERVENRYSALHDPLTGLPNRRLLMERLGQALARDDRFHTWAAVMFIDLDAFKPVNDLHGHAFGDRLLKEVAKRMQDAVRATDTVARLGGDEFVVLVEDLVDPDAARQSTERLLQGFREPLVVDGVKVPVELSVGCALHPRDGSTPRELLEAADEAMYRMKRRHGRR